MWQEGLRGAKVRLRDTKHLRVGHWRTEARHLGPRLAPLHTSRDPSLTQPPPPPSPPPPSYFPRPLTLTHSPTSPLPHPRPLVPHSLTCPTPSLPPLHPYSPPSQTPPSIPTTRLHTISSPHLSTLYIIRILHFIKHNTSICHAMP